MTPYDAVVVGAGPNGLVAANVLADEGWQVLMLEAQPEVGGAVRSDRDLEASYVHDTFSAFYPFGAASPVLRALRLEEYGVRWVHAPAVLGNPLADGGWAVLHRDRNLTAAWLDRTAPGDGDRWLALVEGWDRYGTTVVEAMLAPFPPVRAGLAAVPGVMRGGGLDLVQQLLTPVLELARGFAGEGPGLLLSGNAAHSDIPLSSPGSGLLGLMMTMLGQTVGYPAPEGGAGRLAEALLRRAQERRVTVVCGREVTSVEVRDGRAVGVRTADGELHPAGRAVLADVAAPVLFRRLLAPGDVPARVRRGLDRFRLDPGTVKVDWALSGPVPWAEPPPEAPGTVHLAGSLAELDRAQTMVAAGVVPREPFVIAGLMTTTDPTRSPEGTESMWAYAHVPQPGASVRDEAEEGDEAGGVTGAWDASDCERFADRMQARIERLAPGFSSRVRARRVLGPRELEARDANLVGGAIGGGTAQVHQELVFRPVPGMRGRPETGVRGLYLASSSAHPGGGVHGACGNNAARAALLHDRVGRVTGRIGRLRTGYSHRA